MILLLLGQYLAQSDFSTDFFTSTISSLAETSNDFFPTQTISATFSMDSITTTELFSTSASTSDSTLIVRPSSTSASPTITTVPTSTTVLESSSSSSMVVVTTRTTRTTSITITTLAPVQCVGFEVACGVSLCCGSGTKCDLNSNTCVDEIITFRTSSTTSLSPSLNPESSSNDSSSTAINVGLLMAILIPVLVIMLVIFAFLFFKNQARKKPKDAFKEFSKHTNSEVSYTTHNDITQIPVQTYLESSVKTHPSLLRNNLNLMKSDAPRIVQVGGPSIQNCLQLLDSNSLSWQELEEQVKPFKVKLSSMFSCNNSAYVEQRFKSKTAEFSDNSTSFLFHHPKNQLFHSIERISCGTDECSICSILASGFNDSNPNHFGSGSELFGHGIYFSMSPKPMVSNNSSKFMVFVCQVALGNAFYPVNAFPEGPILLPEGTNAVYGVPDVLKPLGILSQEEFVVYNADQAIAVYLCEFEEDVTTGVPL